ncbi:Na+/H+ antiporter subunit B [Meridianimarinicoccus roseus]|uniref:Na+/H+ antiporter subunit B n=1 Tax=Meridianimarinicoccus roseus TaxID=2072018 RepID=A0A2V2LFE7_9RHOB|nr:Na+/H+ antiporter subunit B [Meridianimarinicoccus roseus]PWR04350.1 Na+/H+ antiporter subunit B [Meridianimarinicoccus roseus]
MNSLILTTATRLIVAILLVFSVFMLLRGHNEPGGGFIGGLIGATGFVMYAIACGTAEARAALRAAPEQIAMVGLGVAALAGLASALFADPLFTGQWLFLGASEGEKGLPLSTVLVFDIGVYLVVMGGILTLVFALEEEI